MFISFEASRISQWLWHCFAFLALVGPSFSLSAVTDIGTAAVPRSVSVIKTTSEQFYLIVLGATDTVITQTVDTTEWVLEVSTMSAEILLSNYGATETSTQTTLVTTSCATTIRETLVAS